MNDFSKVTLINLIDLISDASREDNQELVNELAIEIKKSSSTIISSLLTTQSTPIKYCKILDCYKIEKPDHDYDDIGDYKFFFFKFMRYGIFLSLPWDTVLDIQYAFKLNCLVLKHIYPMYLFSLFIPACKEKKN